jgi:hypothetical protein
MTSQPLDWRIRLIIFIDASCPSKREAAVTNLTEELDAIVHPSQIYLSRVLIKTYAVVYNIVNKIEINDRL